MRTLLLGVTIISIVLAIVRPYLTDPAASRLKPGSVALVDPDDPAPQAVAGDHADRPGSVARGLTGRLRDLHVIAKVEVGGVVVVVNHRFPFSGNCLRFTRDRQLPRVRRNIKQDSAAFFHGPKIPLLKDGSRRKRLGFRGRPVWPTGPFLADTRQRRRPQCGRGDAGRHVLPSQTARRTRECPGQMHTAGSNCSAAVRRLPTSTCRASARWRSPSA
jgi:hypothetical protein